LNSMIENISFDERRSMTLRAYLAKENAIELNNEILDKRRFLRKYKQIEKGFLQFEAINKIRFLESRAYELDLIMQEVRSDIDIAIEKYGHIIEYENSSNSDKLNDIMSLFSLFSIACLPAGIIGSLFGMNMKVPF
jgi:Mg2+ and Co2+ transporter CorA